MKTLIHNKFVVFGVDNYNSLGIIRSLGENGIKPILIAIDSRCNIAYKSKYLSEYHRVSSLEEGYKLLLTYGDPVNKTFIYTNDDKAQNLIDKHYYELESNFIPFKCHYHNIEYYMNKFNILKLAEDSGLKTLKTLLIDRSQGSNLEKYNIEYPIITKSISPLEGGWKSDVHICDNERELQNALKIIKSDKVLIQQFVDKRNEYCLDGFVANGEVYIPIVTTYNYIIQGYYSPYMTVAKTIKPELYNKLCNMFNEIGYSGIFSVEFIIDKSDNYYFSEINFRNSTWSYIGTKLGINLPYIWANKIIDKDFEIKEIEVPDNYTAMVEPIDYQKRVIELRYNRIKWFIDFIKTNCKFYFNIKDIKPFLYMLRYNKKLR